MNTHLHDAPADAQADPPNPDRSGLSSGSSQRPKRKLAVYWAASCGGCDIALLGISERILDVAKAFEIVFWPCVADAKVRDVERLPDGSIDLCLFNGGIRNSEHEYMARLLRSKSKTLVAFGSCAIEGGMPGLANLHSRADVFATVYADSESTENPQHVWPQPETAMPEGTLHLPVFYNTLKTLSQTVPVDYYLPGCPPESEPIWEVLVAAMQGKLPERGSVLAPPSTVCDQCPRNAPRSGSSDSIDRGRSFRTRRSVSWIKGLSAAASPLERDAEPFARK